MWGMHNLLGKPRLSHPARAKALDRALGGDPRAVDILERMANQEVPEGDRNAELRRDEAALAVFYVRLVQAFKNVRMTENRKLLEKAIRGDGEAARDLELYSQTDDAYGEDASSALKCYEMFRQWRVLRG